MNDFKQKLGLTRSLKPIFQPVVIDPTTLSEITSDFTMPDYFDAFSLFEYLLARELAANGRDSPRSEIYYLLSQWHKERLNPDAFTTEMKILRLTTIFDIIECGKSRADALFVD